VKIYIAGTAGGGIKGEKAVTPYISSRLLSFYSDWERKQTFKLIVKENEKIDHNRRRKR